MRIRSMVLSAICLLVSLSVFSQVQWTGAGDGSSWSDAANWSTNAVPIASDDVVLDNTTVTSGYDVTLPSGATTVTVNSITITPATGNSISLILPATNTATTGLHLTSTADALTLNSGGVFINASGSNVDIDGNLVIASGGSLDASAGSLSPVLSIKGNITISAPATDAITESGTGNPVVQLNGNTTQTITSVTGGLTGDNLDFVVNTTGTINLLSNLFLPHALDVQAGTIDISNGAVGDTLGIKGDLTIDGLITESGTGTLSRILLNGTTNQNIKEGASGNITGDALDFRLSNAAGATLLSDLVLPFRYTIKSGNLTLGNYSLTTPFVALATGTSVITNHIITNGTGFLIIPNVGLARVSFPVGVDATSVNQVEIDNGSGLTYSVRVEPGVNPTITTPFAAVDRTWIINTNSAAANPVPANVTFYYYTGQGRSQFDYNSTVDIGQFLTSAWNIIQNGLTPTANPPEYRAYAPITSFNTPFIIGNHGAILPIDFAITCKAQKKENGAVINWNVYSENNVSHYEIEQAIDGGNFKTIASVNPGKNDFSYAYTIKNIKGGTTIYRIKVVLIDGRVRYSNTVAVLYSTRSFLVTSVTPNPATDNTSVTISSPESIAIQAFLFDSQGKMVRQWEQNLNDGTNVIPFNISGLRAGVYFLSITNGSIKANTVRIVKQ
ncbi:MAG: T9SS type A sorting domain-containing protein [Chitinophagaceae bacterium]